MPETITSHDARYALDIVKAICTQAGPGIPGSPQEGERAALIKKELELHLGAGNVEAEEFTAAPGAFLSAYPMSALLMLIATVFNFATGRIPGVSPWLTASMALGFAILSPLPFIFEFILYLELVDPVFKKKQSFNVVGRLRRPGTQSVKRLLILSGHHDSAPENTWLRLLGYGFVVLTATWFIGLIAVLAMSIIQLAGLITGQTGNASFGTVGWILLAYPIGPAIIFGMFFTTGRKNGGTVPGAADNLSACALAVAMCRFLVQNPEYIPADTEIRFVSFGCEEAGMRGSRRYVARHRDELKHLDARLLNIETVACPEISILTSDMAGTVKNSPEMVKSAAAAAERAGVPYRLTSATLGVGNDSGPFSQAGLKAITLLGFRIPQQMVAFYHQRWDRPEILTVEPLFNMLKLMFEWVCSGGERV